MQEMTTQKAPKKGGNKFLVRASDENLGTKKTGLKIFVGQTDRPIRPPP
jgi:hypothetical protein